MLETPETTQSETQSTAVIHLTIPREEIQNEMGPAMQEVMTAVAAQGMTPTGPLFSHHFRMSPETFDFEVGVPVATAIQASGRVQPGELLSRKVARTVYSGPFEGLGPAWGEFGDWISAQGLAPAEDLWERYLSGPESSPDPANWRTELNRPLED